jgi:hypothetical protein
MEPSDLTIQVLREIRDEIRQTNEKIDRMNGRLEEPQAPSEILFSTALDAVTKARESVRQLLAERLDLRDRVDEHDRRISALENLASE